MWTHSCTVGTSLHERVEERRIDEVEEVANELRGNLRVDLAVAQHQPGLGQNIREMPDLTGDLQSAFTPDPGALGGLPERVAIQKGRQDGVEELERQNRMSEGNRAAQFESDSLTHNSCGSN